MGNLIPEENGKPQSHVELKQHFFEIQSNYHIALAVAPSRIAIRPLDCDHTAHYPLHLRLVLAGTENPICSTSKRFDETIVQKIANLSFGMSARCQTTLPLSSLFLPWHVLE
ncbi:hypothetical protein AVEN_264196-1 [Araneus ventricosus]|uniref:Uncharacterized protein n=1 Tax=Araneus ventricosus TaxID=182803 RepID=A0A4Y2R1S2_ARAVE|nr:hypothetical protein AVEN_264196-1 [Araneus ventricosus]